MVDYGSVNTTVSILSLIGSTFLFLFYKVIDKYIAMKYGIKVENKLQTWDVILDKVLETGAEKLTLLLPVLKDYKASPHHTQNQMNAMGLNTVSNEVASIPSPIVTDKLDDIKGMLSKLIGEVELVKVDINVLSARLTQVEQDVLMVKINGSGHDNHEKATETVTEISIEDIEIIKKKTDPSLDPEPEFTEL